MDVGVVSLARRDPEEHIVFARCHLRHVESTIGAHLRHPAALRVPRIAWPEHHDQARRQLPVFRSDDPPAQARRSPWSYLNALQIRNTHLQSPPRRHPVLVRVEACCLNLKTIRARHYAGELELALG